MRKIVNDTITPIITYSQNREDIILASLFQGIENGFYIDIGAGNPDYLSVTKYFYTKGWSGINIEPSQRLFDLLKHTRARDKTYRYAITNDEKKTALYREYLGDGLSTLSKKMQSEYESEPSVDIKYHRDYDVPTISLRKLFTKNTPNDIHFMKVDVEGSEYEVLSSNDWKKFRPRVLCVEANHMDQNKNWELLLADEGYQRIYHDGLNNYYADSRFYETLPTVDYNFVFNPKITSPVWSRVVENRQREIRDLEMELNRVKDELKKRPTVDGEGMRFRVLGKILLKKIDAVITGQLAPAPPNEIEDKIKEIEFTSVKEYDSRVWDVVTREFNKYKPSLFRRFTFKAYRGFKKLVKTIVKMKGKK